MLCIDIDKIPYKQLSIDFFLRNLSMYLYAENIYTYNVHNLLLAIQFIMYCVDKVLQ